MLNNNIGIDIGALVQRILSDLHAPQAVSVRESLREEEPPSGRGHDDPSELRLTHKVITLTEIVNRLDRVERLVVPVGAVVTPAVRDELRKHGIALRRVGANRSGAHRDDNFRSGVRENGGDAKPCGPSVWVALHAVAHEPRAILEMLRKNYDVAPRAFGCIHETVEAAAEAATREPDRFSGVVLTSFPAAGLCVANRRERLRAVFAWEVNRLKIDVKHIGANLLVFDPDIAGFYKTREFLNVFLANAPHEVPAGLRRSR